MVDIFTPQVIKHMKDQLKVFHSIFTECSIKAEYLEELLAKSLTGDLALAERGVKIKWNRFSHNSEQDILITHEGEELRLSVKTGKMVNNAMSLSGYRLQTILGANFDLAKATTYLHEQGKKSLYITCPSLRKSTGWEYTLYKIEAGILSPDLDCVWEQPLKKGNLNERVKDWRTTNALGVEFTIRPSMSSQVWWSIPSRLLTEIDRFDIPC